MSIEWRINLGFDRIRENVSRAADKAVTDGVALLESFVVPVVPVETGHLASTAEAGTGKKFGVGPDGDHVAHLYFAGPYALYQHEGVYFRRPAHFGAPLTHTHGQNFFLIQPLISHRPEIRAVMGATVKSGMHR